MINLKLRLQNEPTLLAIIVTFIALVYQILGLCGVVEPISENTATEIAGIIITLLAAGGIIIDPTTKGIADSTAALNYDSPRNQNEEDKSLLQGMILGVGECEEDE